MLLKAASLGSFTWANQNWVTLFDWLGIHIHLSPVVPKLDIEAKIR